MCCRLLKLIHLRDFNCVQVQTGTDVCGIITPSCSSLKTTLSTLTVRICVFQACLPGFRRVNGHLYSGVCEPCRCHGHATQCHEVTGHCLVRYLTTK